MIDARAEVGLNDSADKSLSLASTCWTTDGTRRGNRKTAIRRQRSVRTKNECGENAAITAVENDITHAIDETQEWKRQIRAKQGAYYIIIGERSH